MEKEQPKWKRISKGEKLPCWAFLMMMDGTITNVTAMGVTIKQDAYYLPSYGLIETIKDFPKEESEDEKIRKTLINHFKTQVDLRKTWNGIKNIDILVWLEKQGEQKKIDYNEELKKCKSNSLYFFDKYVKVKLKEQNPDWSEEDILMKGEIINVLQKTGNYEKEINWLKSLKERYAWKPSDEQIDCLSKHIEYERRWNSSYALNVLSELLEQLKKLK